MDNKHQLKINRICIQLNNRKGKGQVSLLKKSVSHQVPKPNGNKEKIDVSDLDDILLIDPSKKYCVCEPGVTFSDLVTETLKHNLVPKLVPELKTITVGGAISGCSVESMSYKYGGFHDSCTEYEVITSKGKVITCNNDRNKLIFEMMQGSFGTLGILSKITFDLIDAKPFVKINYIEYNNYEDYKNAITAHFHKKDIDFMDGIIHSQNKYILSIGNFENSAPYIGKYDWMNIYYKSTGNRKEDHLKTYDYFFRYDAECHWITRNYGLENPLLRFLFGKFFLGSTNMLTAAHKYNFLSKKKPDIVLDVFMPFSKFSGFMEFYYKKFNYFPIWIVPYKIKKYPWISDEYFSKVEDELFIDIAIYGFHQKGTLNYYRLIEKELLRIGGIKTLISYNYFSEDEFWSVWNKKNYQSAKKQTDPDNIFQDIYKKTHNKQ
ncbi:MAG: FAD-binding oxidoreductase [archaeon]